MSAKLVVEILGDVSNLSKGLDDGGRKVSAFGKTIDVGGVAKMAAFATVAGAAVVGLLELGDAARTDAAEAAALQQALTNAGAATGDWAAQVETAIAKGQELAFTDTQIREALAALAPVYGSVAASADAMALAQDVARAAHVDLATAAEAVAKAEDGTATALAKMLNISAKGKDAAEILAEAQRRAGGQAKVWGESGAGAAERNGIALAEMGEKIGSLVLPILDALVPAILPIIDALTEIMDAILPILIPLIKVLGSVLASVARVIAGVARAIADLIGWLADAIGTVGDFVASLGPVQALGDVFGGLFGPGALPGMAGTTGGPGAAMGPGGPIINVTASGADPEAVIRALARWAGVNGGWPAVQRAVERGG